MPIVCLLLMLRLRPKILHDRLLRRFSGHPTNILSGLTRLSSRTKFVQRDRYPIIRVKSSTYSIHSPKSIPIKSAPITIIRLSYFLAGYPCTCNGVYRFTDCCKVVQMLRQVASKSGSTTMISACRLARNISLKKLSPA